MNEPTEGEIVEFLKTNRGKLFTKEQIYAGIVNKKRGG